MEDWFITLETPKQARVEKINDFSEVTCGTEKGAKVKTEMYLRLYVCLRFFVADVNPISTTKEKIKTQVQ
jgi:hypothetical protein